MFNQYGIWLTEHEACRYVNRTPRTLESWRHQHKVIARKRRDTWEYDQLSLKRQLQWTRYRYEQGRNHHPKRAEAIQYIHEAFAYKIRPPDTTGLARMMGVKNSWAYQWKIQALAWGVRANTWATKTDQEIAYLSNSTLAQVAKARKERKRH